MKQREIAVSGWEALGRVDPTDLTGARLQIHWAAQILGSFGESHVPHERDFSHTNMGWNGEHQWLVSHAAGARPLRAAIAPASLRLLLLDEDETPAAELELAGKTLDEAYSWLDSEVHSRLDGAQPFLSKPTYEMPEHPVAEGRPFELDRPEALAEVARWYANADRALRWLQTSLGEDLPIRCWPHHFDIAMLLRLDSREEVEDDELARSIGLGMTPGDVSYAEPYFYVSPWPYPQDRELPILDGGGTWHTGGWVGGVLTGTRLVQAAAAEVQAERTTAYLESALEACQQLLAPVP